MLRPNPQLPYDFSVLGSQLRLYFPSTFHYLGLDFLSTFHYLRPDFSSTFLIFGVSSPQVSLEKVDDFSFFSRAKL